MMNSTSMENQMDRFTLERRELMDKIERLAKENAEMEKRLAHTQGRLNSTENMNEMKEKEMGMANRDLQTEKAELLGKLENMRER